MFLNPLSTVARPDGKFELLNDLHYQAENEAVIIVPRGFITDYASVPWFGRWLIPKIGRYNRAAVLHDYLWSTAKHKVYREWINQLFYQAMKADKVVWWKRKLIFWAVELYRILDNK